ncbi:heavy metal-associated isoprenylated plant protein 43 [Coffea eugenioides]|uniref:heavy metal-associated isoprenylated plant protein 43 n=1 Tax=Coffea eugenioides TaxID=49369 RepID=UPI000F605814|nr:heavy metal-associated isoprenylated plant protein 43 [Coffea eugenioides]
MKKTEVKVNINCHKCKSDVLKAVTKLQGVDQVTADAAKGIVTVVGEVDPVCVITRVRKTGKFAEIISVGPPKKPDPPKTVPAKPDKPDNDPPKPLPPSCPQCQYVVVSYVPDDSRICSIL